MLADGVAHATALPPLLPGMEGQPDLVIDMATLTGAQVGGAAPGRRAFVWAEGRVRDCLEAERIHCSHGQRSRGLAGQALSGMGLGGRLDTSPT